MDRMKNCIARLNEALDNPRLPLAFTVKDLQPFIGGTDKQVASVIQNGISRGLITATGYRDGRNVVYERTAPTIVSPKHKHKRKSADPIDIVVDQLADKVVERVTANTSYQLKAFADDIVKRITAQVEVSLNRKLDSHHK